MGLGVRASSYIMSIATLCSGEVVQSSGRNVLLLKGFPDQSASGEGKRTLSLQRMRWSY